ncbi:MAG TPA: 2-C-methyl-D-erythritol 4-phosphate cytidylyltransferase, partial [Chromatiales bacterium]|nr:2-C-methyl-D-erythritol 4-phosphate cytidylyltransferase [Chromatiales bacterium]
MINIIERLWAVVPAAGIGRRMGGGVPKQYLPLGGRRVIDWTLERLLAVPSLEAVYVALAEADAWWTEGPYVRHPRIRRVAGGEERAHSVLNALRALEAEADAEDWVLVHDAARPCLRVADVERLVEEVSAHPVGGILAAPLHDTVKRAWPHRRDIRETVPREELCGRL